MKYMRRVVLFVFVPLMLIVTGCGGCGDQLAGPGESCDMELDEACENGDEQLECITDDDGTDRCLRPVGTRCDSDGDADNCEPDTACKTDSEGDERCLIDEAANCDPDDNLCADGFACEELEDGDYGCYQPLTIQGSVFDAETEEAIEDAHVIAFDEERSALSDVAVTDEDGDYSMSVPAMRGEDGEPVQQFFTLRASAQDYQTFPGGIREAQPIDASDFSEDDDQWVIDTSQTDVALIELPADERGHAHIRGTVDIDGGLGGVLVVAEPDDIDDHEEQDSATGISAVSGLDGSFTIFNVPDDSYDVRGFLADYQIEPEEVTMDDENIDDLVLTEADDGPTDVSGNLQIVRTEGATSVLLMVASTFDPTSNRGETPAGLRAPKTGEGDISGDWTIEGVPAGEYVAVAAFENDDLVRSLDEGIAGTDLVYFEVNSEDDEFAIGESFKVTSALETFGPGAEGPEGVSERPTLRWGSLSNADWYDVIVYDAFGNLVFEETDIEHSGGQNEYTAEYDGDFEEGMYYQFRATAHRADSAVTSTEFLRGVFYAE